MTESFFSLKTLWERQTNSTKSESFWNIPNFITSSRIISALLSIILLLIGAWPTFTFSLKFYEAISDLADGFTARILDCETEFGAKFDTVADKIVIGSSAIFIILVTLGFLTYLNRPYPQVDIGNLIILLGLDALLFIIGLVASKFGFPVKANIAGKAKMFCECILINFWFLSYLAPLEINFKPEIASLWINKLIIASIICATLSIALHLAKHIKTYLKKSE